MCNFVRNCLRLQNIKLFILALCWLPCAPMPNHDAKTLKYFSDIRPEGSYEYAYETDNGIYAEERGSIKNTNSEDAGLTVEGAFQYQSPEGVPIHLVYTADENGFHPQGEHLPTPPPIPPQILKALAWIEEQRKKKEQASQQNGIKDSFFDNVSRF